MAKRYGKRRSSGGNRSYGGKRSSGMRRGNAQRVVVEIHHVAPGGIDAGNPTGITATGDPRHPFVKPAPTQPGRGSL